MVESRLSSVFGPSNCADTDSELIYSAVANRRGVNAYLSFAATLRDDVLTSSLDTDAAARLDERDLCLSFFECRAIGLIDKYFDTHRDEFAVAIRHRPLFLQTLGQVPIGLEKYRLDFNFADMMSVLESRINDPILYPDGTVRRLLGRDYAQLISAIGLLTLEAAVDTMTPNEVMRLKMGTNTAHALMMFDLESARLLEHYPLGNYREARRRYVSGVLAYQIADDLRDFTLDGRERNANLWISTARSLGEKTELPTTALETSDPNSTDFIPLETVSQEAAIVIPRTYRILHSLQNKLLEVAQAERTTQAIRLRASF